MAQVSADNQRCTSEGKVRVSSLPVTAYDTQFLALE